MKGEGALPTYHPEMDFRPELERVLRSSLRELFDEDVAVRPRAEQLAEWSLPEPAVRALATWGIPAAEMGWEVRLNSGGPPALLRADGSGLLQLTWASSMAIGIDPGTHRVHGVHYSVVDRGAIARESLTNSSVELFVDCAWRFHWVAREVTRLESTVDDAMFAHIYHDAPAVEFTPDDFRSPFNLVADMLVWILRVDPDLRSEAEPTWKSIGELILPL